MTAGSPGRAWQLKRYAAAVACLGALVVGWKPEPAAAYRHYAGRAADYIVGSDEAIRWSADIWGPGDTLVWRIEDGPDWARLWDSVSEVTPLVEGTLSAWSGIETADISWRLEGVRGPPEESRFGDSRNAVYLDTWSDIVGAVHWWVRNDASDRWRMAECDVGLPWYWWLDEKLERHDDLDAEGLTRWTTDFLAEELGHCLGLRNTEPFPGSRHVRQSIRAEDGSEDIVWWRRTAVWAPSPTMDSGSPPLALDDRVGASLARPRTGWGASVGGVAGILESEGERVRYAYVWAVRRLPSGEMRNPVGAFSNGRGEFLIEGLEAGQYILWAKPIRSRWSHPRLIASDATTDVKDSVLALPVQVVAGRVTDGIAISLTRSRE
ncbi:MAG: hypothetical protein OXC11_15455 [Rhodospirillales bacterium]|nr:hypothetical protein [Rhodospirillales bacterium]